MYLDTLSDSIAGYKERMGEPLKLHPLSIHGPFLDLCPHSFDKAIQETSRKRFEQAYYAAKELGAKHLIIHSCYIPDIYFKEVWEENSIEFWMEFLEDKDDSVKIHIENVFENDFKYLYNLVNKINNPIFKLCLDVGHVNAYSKIPIKEWFIGLKDHIGHLHLHNNDGEKDLHWPLDKGTLNMEEVFEYIREYAPQLGCTIEMANYEDAKNSLEYILKR